MSGGLEPGDIVADRYRIERLLGKGGMGAVYEALHTVTLRRGALKVLHGELSHAPEVVARFLREASAAGRIGNAHIVETFDAGRCEGGEPYIFMELLRGLSLEDQLQASGRVPFELAVEYTCQACRGLAAAHDAGIVHRDIKPENPFLLDAAKPFIKILDFGISKFDPALTAARALTVEGSALGTPFFMSPEQVVGKKDIDHRSDIYSLAVTFYRLLSGTYPFIADTLPAISILIHQGKFAPVSTLCRVPNGCDEVLARAMATDPDQRISAAGELEHALRALLPTGCERSAPESEIALGATVQSTAPPGPVAVEGRGVGEATPAPLSRTLPRSTRSRHRGVHVALGGAAAVVGAGVYLAVATNDGSDGRSSVEPEPAVAAPGASSGAAPAPDRSTAPRASLEPPAPSASGAPHSEPARPKGSAPRRPMRKATARPAAATSSKRTLKAGRLGSEFTREFE